MEIKIYQINHDRDKHGVMFVGYDELERYQKTSEIDSGIYDKVFEGTVPGDHLENVYRVFNVDHPAGYRGRSLSMSDIVQIVDSKTYAPGFYYCDRIGFKEILFDPSKAVDETPPTIDVILAEPGKLARVAKIDASLEGMQAVVKGRIEAFYPFEEQVCIVCNEEGKINGLPLNRAVYVEDEVTTEMTYGELTKRFRAMERSSTGQHMLGYIVFTEDSFTEPYSEEARTYVVSSDNKAFIPNMGGYSIYGASLDGEDPMARLDQCMADEHGGKNGWRVERCHIQEPAREMIDVVAGTFFVCDCSGENFGSLSEDQQKRFAELFKQPERFVKIAGEIVAIPYIPARSQER